MTAHTAIHLLMALGVAWIQGWMNPLWVWNALPIVVSWLLASPTLAYEHSPWPGRAFALFGCGIVVLVHLSWSLDRDDAAPGSSTSGLIFLSLPVYAMVIGGVAFAVAYLLVRGKTSGDMDD